ncbi:alpha-hydroxy acid oxidase [Mesorhizobium sp. CAU 1741]|uniref:alpha-hydroxy acid oxidase n=1 Tax=Mesorhizobium sp. CAU 1741 TaxID=3140366 RepID=UPI00325B644E
MDRDGRLARWRMRYPTVTDLVPRARRRVPGFAFDFLEGGTGEELCLARNRAALDGIEIVPRFGIDVSSVEVSVRLLGRRHAAPLVIAPIGMDGAVWPGATRYLAQTAQDLDIAYMPSTMAAAAIEDIAAIAPGQAWFQLYGFPADDHAVTFDLISRAERAGVHALAVTLDIPVPARRARDMRNGLLPQFRVTPGKIATMLARPTWLAALARDGLPVVHNMKPYCREGAGKNELDRFVQQGRAGSGITWDVIARIRERWKKPLMVKGILHPADAERAASLGLDGIVVSNHGGRQFDAAPAPINVLPAIRATVGDRLEVLVDGGIMSGTDILKALACGADAVLAGRAFMLGLAALGGDGARHVAATMTDELRVAMAQAGIVSLDQARTLSARHPGAWKQDLFRVSAEEET